MHVATVVGQVVSTVKPDSIAGVTILLLQDVDAANPGEALGTPYAAIDLIGAGRGEIVLVSTGSAARADPRTAEAPVDATVIAIVDSLVRLGAQTYQK